jgi:hypothetical protein
VLDVVLGTSALLPDWGWGNGNAAGGKDLSFLVCAPLHLPLPLETPARPRVRAAAHRALHRVRGCGA